MFYALEQHENSYRYDTACMEHLKFGEPLSVYKKDIGIQRIVYSAECSVSMLHHDVASTDAGSHNAFKLSTFVCKASD